MNKLSLLIGLCLWVIIAHAQAPQQKPAPTTPQAKPGPPQPRPQPYVMKKDYDVQMQEMTSKVNAALNAKASIKKELSGELEKVNELDLKMQKVEEILNSASFQIAVTSDSLKTTRFSVEEYRAKTDASFQDLADKNSQLRMIAIIFFVALLAVVSALFLMMNMNIKKLKNALQQQAEAAKSNLLDESNRHQKLVKDEIQSLQTRIQGNMNVLKTEITTQIDKERQNTSSQISSIMDKLNEKQAD